MRDLLQDVRIALRGFRRNPGFTFLVVTVLALGIGANAAIFSVVDALVLRSLPFPDADHLVTVHTRSLQTGRIGPVSFPDMVDVREQSGVFQALALYRPRGLVLSGRGDPETLNGVIASANLFTVLGVEPALGRGFRAGEDEPGQPRVAVVSHALWRRKLGGDPAAIGSTIILNGEPFTVVGVAPAGFRFPLDDRPPEFWVPLDRWMDKEARQWRSMMPYRSAVARLRPGFTVEQAQVALDLVRARQAKAYPKDDGGHLLLVRSFHDEWVAGGRTALLVLLGAVGFVLLIACANVASLQLSRALARRRELGIRTALGAGRGRIVRQLLTESFLLALAGAGAGLVLAQLGLDAIVAVIPPDVARPHAISLDGRVLAFAASVAVASGALIGVAPALLATRTEVRAALAEGDRGSAGARGRVRAVLLVAEVALAMLLVIGAGLLMRTFVHVSRIDPGFDTRSMLTARLKTSARTVKGETLYRELAAGLDRIPGAQGTVIASPLPFVGWYGGTMHFTLDDRPPPPGNAPFWLQWNSVSPGYFAGLGIPVLRGRTFDATDPDVAVVNESFARRYFADGSPLGRRVLAYNRYDWRIIGVVADNRGATCPPSGCRGFGGDDARLEQAPEPVLYTSLARGCCGPDLFVGIRHPAPLTAVGPLRALVREIDPAIPVEDVLTMDEAIGRSLAERRLHTLLVGLFSAMALALAVIGIYGVLSYAVAQRTREVAIRLALGARERQVMVLVVGQGLRLAMLGLLLGMAGAMALTRVLQSQLYGVSPTDPLTFAAVAALLAAAATLASYLPARRAARVDPMIALRSE